MTKFVRLIDTKRCMGCRACLSACAVENHFTPDAPWNVMIEYEIGTSAIDAPTRIART